MASGNNPASSAATPGGAATWSSPASSSIWRYSHGAWSHAHATALLAAATETLQLWDGELSYPDLAEDIAVEARLALSLSAEIRDLDVKLAALLHQADPDGILTSVPGVGIITGAQILARLVGQPPIGC